jgi:hypothetical protein
LSERDPVRKTLRGLPLAKTPDALWASIDREFAKPAPRQWSMAWAVWAAAAIVILAIGGMIYRRASMGVIQTDASSTARINIGTIGMVELEPNTRVRMEVSNPNEQRLRLEHGEIRASVSAPPRLFFVDTPASTAVDLGCAYSMKTDKAGDGLLRVTLGWVSLEWAGRESLVPAHAMCRTRPKIGPGTPYFEDASPGLSDALARFDFESGGDAALATVLVEARVRDTLTLWHLLSRTEGAERERVFDRMVELVPLPYGVAREKALSLDAATLKHWKEELAWKW